MRHFIKIVLSAILIGTCAIFTASAQDNADSDIKTLLVINSYSEMSPWVNNMLTPIMVHAAMYEDIHVELVNLNSTVITDSATYNLIKANALANYADRRIDYVTFIGDMAFTLRDEVRDKWGDIPMLLITRDLTLGPDEDYYFSGFDKPLVDGDLPSVDELRPDYNFSAIYVPDFYKETIDLMVDLIPDMDELVFFSDAIYFNRYLSNNIERYLMVEHPDLKYKWVKATSKNADEFNRYLVQRQPKKGLLLSSWLYANMGPLGYPAIVSGDINILHSSINPVFSLRVGYMSLGAVGGVYSDYDDISKAITEYVQAMFDNKQMRDIKIYVNKEPRGAILNYQLFKKFDMPFNRCPNNVEFTDKPLSFWEKYTWQIIVGILTFALVVLLFAKRSAAQRRKIETLTRHKQFVDNMPIPYSKGRVLYDNDMKTVLNITYTMSNQAFDDIIRENSEPRSQYKLFTPEFISQKTSEMLQSGKEISFIQHFEKTDKYYIFTLCLVDSAKSRTANMRGVIDTIDIFAIDITQKQKSEDNLKDITQRLDMTLDVANLIPWEWNMLTDMMTFDASNVFHRTKRTFDPISDLAQQSRVSFGDFMKLVHPDDRNLLRELREKLFLDEVKTFNIEYRIYIAKQNKQTEEWIEIRGSISRRDETGKPTAVMGIMTVVTERKKQQLAVATAERKSIKAEAVKREYINNISHEIRVKLNDIIGFASLMCETEDQKKRQEFSEIISTNNQELLDYIDSLVEDSSKDSDDETAVQDTPRPEDKPKPQTKPAKPEHETVTVKPAAVPAQTTLQPGNDAKTVVKGGPKKVILIAEDIEGNYLLLKNYIPKQYELVHAWTGQEAVELFQKHNPDLILMDIGMPIMDGYKATAEIRKLNTTVPIVAVTAYAANSDRDLILKSGFDDYITKPVMRPVITEALSRYL